VIPLIKVWDYEYGLDGKPLIYEDIRIQSQPSNLILVNPPVDLAPVLQDVKTDGNGYWSVLLPSNANALPANSSYTRSNKYNTKRFQITGTAGPYQCRDLMVDVPVNLPVATTVLNGPLTVPGLLTAQAGLSVVGPVTLPAGSIPDADMVTPPSHPPFTENQITGLQGDLTTLTNNVALRAPIASPTFTGITTAPEFSASGLTGATAGTRYVGATNGGPPTTGTYAVGDTVVDRLYGLFWVCTGAGPPGTWMPVGTGNLKARMHRVAALSITAGSFGVIPFDTVTYDPHGNMTTGAGAKYTCLLAGKYLVTGRAEITNAADRGITSIFKNGVEYARGSDNLNSTTSQGPVGDVVDCAAGDTLDLRIFATTGPATGDNGAALMFMSVAYQGA